MNYADMILDSVGVANLDEVNLSYMIVSVVIFQKFTWLNERLDFHLTTVQWQWFNIDG